MNVYKTYLVHFSKAYEDWPSQNIHFLDIFFIKYLLNVSLYEMASVSFCFCTRNKILTSVLIHWNNLLVFMIVTFGTFIFVMRIIIPQVILYLLKEKKSFNCLTELRILTDEVSVYWPILYLNNRYKAALSKSFGVIRLPSSVLQFYFISLYKTWSFSH